MNLNPLQFGKPKPYVSPYESARRDRRREKIATGAVGVALAGALTMGGIGVATGLHNHDSGGSGHVVPTIGGPVYVPGDHK